MKIKSILFFYAFPALTLAVLCSFNGALGMDLDETELDAGENEPLWVRLTPEEQQAVVEHFNNLPYKNTINLGSDNPTDQTIQPATSLNTNKESPEEVRTRARKSGYLSRTYQMANPDTNVKYFAKDVLTNDHAFDGHPENWRSGLIADAILAGCNIEPLLKEPTENILSISIALAKKVDDPNSNKTDEDRASNFFWAVENARGKNLNDPEAISIYDIKIAYLEYNPTLKDYKSYKILKEIEDTKDRELAEITKKYSNFDSPTTKNKTLKEWCKNTQSLLAKKTICALIAGAAAIAVAAKLTYNQWWGKKTTPDTTNPLYITIENKTGTPIHLIVDDSPQGISVGHQGTWSPSGPISFVSVVSQDRALENIRISLSRYQNYRKSNTLHITIDQAPIWKRWWSKTPYTYSIKWK